MDFRRFRVLVAASPEATRPIVAVIESLGHEVLAAELHPDTLVTAVAAAEVEVVVVAREGDGRDSLKLIGMLTREASHPVVAALPAMDAEWVAEAVAVGAFGVVVGSDAKAFRISLTVAHERFLDYRSLQEAFARRAQIEQAKGLLMARHNIGGDQAFTLLRQHSQRTNRKLIEIAAALVKAHVVLSGPEEHRAADSLSVVEGGTQLHA